MKKITIILAMALTASTAFAFTGGETLNHQAINTFNSEFIKASDATWTSSKDFDKVTFTLNGEQLEAYYNKAGEFMALTHNISTVQLPASLKKSLKKSMGNSWITDLFEITNLDQSSWYVTLETADTKVVLKSHNGGRWTVFQKSDK
jgi:ABC-type glycerol-3-phosphate transport system substrate-binding protein